MRKPKPSRSVSALIALVDATIAYWNSIAELSFKKTNPDSEIAEFERVWPNILNNFFLAETIRTIKRLRAFSLEGRDN